jgi:hypothetical protein
MLETEWINWVANGVIFIGLFWFFWNQFFSGLKKDIKDCRDEIHLCREEIKSHKDDLHAFQLEFAKTGVDGLKEVVDKTKDRITRLELSESKIWGCLNKISGNKRLSDQILEGDK